LFSLISEGLNGTGALGRAPVQDSHAVAARRDRLKLLTANKFVGSIGGGEKLQNLPRHHQYRKIMKNPISKKAFNVSACHIRAA